MNNIELEQVSALKYRPHRFEDIVGQSTIVQTLSLALDSNRLSHAYLFSGLRGSGKTSTARIMAKSLLCSNGPTSKPCEKCENCRSANLNKHMDIIEMDAASNRGIDDIKDLIEHTKYKPSSAKYKIFIIDEVHMLTTQAFNALLKTLEEPPPFVKFILATTDPLKLPATILSRTQHFRFNKISKIDVVNHLIHILNNEKIPFTKEALEILARSGHGSLRDTLTLLDQVIIFSKGNISVEAVVDMLGLIDPKMMDNIFQVVLDNGDIRKIVMELQVYEVSQICDEMAIYLKERMLKNDPRFELVLFDRYFRILGDAKHLLSQNSDGGFVLILTLMKLAEASKLKTIDEIIDQVQKLPTKNIISQESKNIVEKKEAPEKDLLKKDKILIGNENFKSSKKKNKFKFSTPFDGLFDQDLISEITTEENSNNFQHLMKDPLSVDKNENINSSNLSNFVDVNDTFMESEAESEFEVDSFEENVQIDTQENVQIDTQENVQIDTQEDIQEKNKYICLYETLTKKIYERNYQLGECFKENFIFSKFKGNILTIDSYAQGEDRKFLAKYYALVKIFVQEVYGSDTQINFIKKDSEKKLKALEGKIEHKVIKKNEELPPQAASMIEDLEDGDKKNTTMSQKEIEVRKILSSPMINKAKDIFRVKKIIVRGKS